jgi:hypothetical protein
MISLVLEIAFVPKRIDNSAAIVEDYQPSEYGRYTH